MKRCAIEIIASAAKASAPSMPIGRAVHDASENRRGLNDGHGNYARLVRVPGRCRDQSQRKTL